MSSLEVQIPRRSTEVYDTIKHGLRYDVQQPSSFWQAAIAVSKSSQGRPN